MHELVSGAGLARSRLTWSPLKLTIPSKHSSSTPTIQLTVVEIIDGLGMRTTPDATTLSFPMDGRRIGFVVRRPWGNCFERVASTRVSRIRRGFSHEAYVGAASLLLKSLGLNILSSEQPSCSLWSSQPRGAGESCPIANLRNAGPSWSLWLLCRWLSRLHTSSYRTIVVYISPSRRFSTRTATW